MKLKIKDIIPDVEVFQLINNEPVKIRVKKMFQEKKSIPHIGTRLLFGPTQRIWEGL